MTGLVGGVRTQPQHPESCPGRPKPSATATASALTLDAGTKGRLEITKAFNGVLFLGSSVSVRQMNGWVKAERSGTKRGGRQGGRAGSIWKAEMG